LRTVPAGFTSDGTASEIDGGSRGIEFLRLFPRFFSAGQDALCENPNIFKSISVVIPFVLTLLVAFMSVSEPSMRLLSITATVSESFCHG
jgi:hypothetical protein